MKTFPWSCFAIVAACLFLGLGLSAQQNYVYSAGNPTFSTNIPVENGFINISNGNLHMEFGLASHPQRGALSLSEKLVYDSKFWTIGHYSNYYWWPDNLPRTAQLAAGWRFVTGTEAGSTKQYLNEDVSNCEEPNGRGGDTGFTINDRYWYSWIDPLGTEHTFNAFFDRSESDCIHNTADPEVTTGYATDGSGYKMTISGDDLYGPQTVTVQDPSGNQVYPTVTDRYGNYWSNDASGNVIDDRGQTPVIRTDNGNTIDFAVLAANGNRVHYIVTTTPVAINTAYQQSAVNEWSGNLNAVQSIQLPNGTTYSFTYDSGSGSGHYGEMTSMTVPEGGVFNYYWGNFSDSYQNQNRWLRGYQVGTNTTTTFSPSVLTTCSSSGTGCQEQVIMHRPSADEVKYTFVLNNGAWNTTTDVYSGLVSSNNKITSTASTYDFTQSCWITCNGAMFVTKQDSTTTLVDVGLNLTTRSSYSNPALGKPSSIKQYNFYSGSLPPSPVTEEQFQYTNFDLTDEKLLDGGGNQVSHTVYNYTSTATATTATGVQQHGTQNAGGPYLSSVDRWVAGSTFLTTSFTHDDTGALLSATDPNGQTTYGYDATDTFVTSTTLPIPSSAIQLSASRVPSAYTGETTQSNGFNSGEQTNTYYDSLGRVDHVNYPDGGMTAYDYSTLHETGVLSKLTSSVSSQIRTLSDPFGRAERTATYNGQSPNPWYQQDTCYDSSGRVSYISVSYQGQGFSAAKICSGTQYTYDALNRPLTIQNADGTTQMYYYGRATRVTDVNGVQKITQVDGLGRITAVCEVSSNTNLPGVQNCANMDISATGLLTTYDYGLVDHRTTITQGSQTRSFYTDALGRPTSTIEPERGTTSYSYTYNTTGLQVVRTRPKANQTNPSTLTSTTTQYDKLGRVASTSYNDGSTSARHYYYDGTTGGGWTSSPANPKGLLSGTSTDSSSNPTASEISYDLMGRVTEIQQCAPSICNGSSRESRPALQFGYDWNGNLTYAFDGASGGISYGRSPVGEITSIYNNTYQNASNPANLVSNIANGPFGPTNWALGNGTSAVHSYDSLGRLAGGWLCSGNGGVGQSAYCAGNTQLYGFIANTSGSRVTGMCDTVMNQCQGHGYDEFNRLKDVSGSVSYHYQYDRWGNRTQQTYDNGGPNYSWSYDNSNNQVNNYPSITFDAAGNQTHDDSGSTYVYDAEGNVVETWKPNQTHTKYVYDALNHRVSVAAPSGTNEFLFDLAGNRYSSWIASNNFGNGGRIYWDGLLLANRGWNGTTYFHHADWLGTERMRTDYQGQVVNNLQSYASGESFTQTANDPFGASQDNSEFTGQEYDAESGTDHFQFRQYQPTQGRWLSPDPYDGSYDSTDPQSFNRYVYAGNSPFSFTDPLGLQHGDPLPPDGGCGWCDALFDAISGAFDGLFGGGPKFHGSLNQRPREIGKDANGHYRFSVYGRLYTGGVTSSSGSDGLLSFESLPLFEGSAPNSGLNGVGPNPCSGANPANLNYQAVNPYNKGADTAFNHIFQNHILGGPGKSVYAGGPGGTAGAVGNMFRLNALTLVHGTLVQPSVGGIAVLSYYEAPGSFGPFSWGHVGTSNGQTTQYNTLVVKNCTVPQTSYPGLPSSYQP